MRSSLVGQKWEANKSIHKFALKPAKSSFRRDDAHQPPFLQRKAETAVLAFNLADAVDYFRLSRAFIGSVYVARRGIERACPAKQHTNMCRSLQSLIRRVNY